MLQDAINKPKFWKDRDSEIRKLQGEIDDLFDFSGIAALSDSHEKLSIKSIIISAGFLFRNGINYQVSSD